MFTADALIDHICKALPIYAYEHLNKIIILLIFQCIEAATHAHLPESGYNKGKVRG
jgi:hypothetical protein